MTVAVTSPVRLEIAFKGDRPYLQSADVFDALAVLFGPLTDVRLKFVRMLSHRTMACEAAVHPDPDSCPARLTAVGGEGPLDLVVYEDADRAVERRVPYDEPRVVADAVIDGASISSSTGQGASALERIVALNKALIHRTVRPGNKLLFSSITLSRTPDAEETLRLTLLSRLGVRLFRSSIEASGERIGELVFYGS